MQKEFEPFLQLSTMRLGSCRVFWGNGNSIVAWGYHNKNVWLADG